MTANAMDGDRERALSSGMNDHISKPLNVDDMFATLAKWIRPQDAPASLNVGLSDGLPDRLEGIDMVAGLATCMGRRELYLRLLCKFRDTQTGFAEHFQAALAVSDDSAAGRVAHSLRGTAGNIGARAVAQAAAVLELACQNDEPAMVVQELATEVERCLLPTLAALAGLTGNAPASMGEAQQDGPELSEQLNRLKGLLAESDTAAMDALTELRNLSLDRALAKRLTLVAEQVQLFDFDRALELLQDC
jgi:HPt (histidine-containing phosphotransfer) domain-containing protein